MRRFTAAAGCTAQPRSVRRAPPAIAVKAYWPPFGPATRGVIVLAQNNYNEVLPSGASNSSEGGAGGFLNGAASLNSITLLGDTSVTTGDSVQIKSGTDPVINPGGILFSASTILM